MDSKATQSLDIGVVRVSSGKQELQGDSPEDQKKKIELHATNLSAMIGEEIKIDRWFEFSESASGEIDMQPVQKIIEFCKNHPVRYLFFKSIDRYTRGGGTIYGMLKMQLSKYGVQLVDTYGIISHKNVNTLEHLGIQFDWSVYSPSWITELLEAERAKADVRDILTRLIGAEVRYTKLGFPVRQAKYGFINTKEDTEHGKRVVPRPFDEEAKFLKRMYDLRLQGNLSDEEIVDDLNKLGYLSRETKRHDPTDRKRIIGFRGKNPLNVKQLRRYLEDPFNVGFYVTVWNKDQPLIKRWDGIVSTDEFNNANRGKVSLVENKDGTFSLEFGDLPEWQKVKTKNNPLYPYKDEILCPTCRKTLLGSASRGKSGQYFPAYHCNRGHYFRVPLGELHKVVQEFVGKVGFSDEFKNRFSEVFLEEWEKRERQLSETNVTLNQRLINIEIEIKNLKEKIKMVSLPEVIKSLENDIERLQQERVRLIDFRDKKEEEQVGAQTLINYAQYYMEHLSTLILSDSDPRKSAAMFGLLFEVPPTYKELVDGTPNLACLFKLNDTHQVSKKLMVSYLNSEWNSVQEWLTKVYYTFREHNIVT